MPRDEETIIGGVVIPGRVAQSPLVGGRERPTSAQPRRRIWLRGDLAAPMLREGQAIGIIMTRVAKRDRFDDRQVALIQTFADQAVIAIENVRLFNETKESLERQTATAEILKVIASSPSECSRYLTRSSKGTRLIGLRTHCEVSRSAAKSPLPVARHNAEGDAQRRQVFRARRSTPTPLRGPVADRCSVHIHRR